MFSLLVRDIVGKRHEAVCVPMETTAVAAARLLRQRGSEALLVRDNRGVCGILTEGDFVDGVVCSERVAAATPVIDLASAPVIHVSLDAPLDLARSMMRQHHIRHLAVTDASGETVAVISARDLLLARRAEQLAHIGDLERYIYSYR